jgi:hypothetical protein
MTESIQVIGQGAKTMPITREAEGANAVPNRIGTVPFSQMVLG